MTVALLLALLAAPAPLARPNIVFVMTDDHAAHAISAYGSRVNRTPNIDRLAKEGMLFRNTFVTNSICTPSRATILTGLYSHKNGVPVFNRFDGKQPNVAKLLQAAGYHTGMIGKWHLGSDPTGFDHWEILPGQGSYMDPVLYTATGEKKYEGRYATDLVTDLAIDFIEKRPKDRPFFLMYHPRAPHRNWVPDRRHPEDVRGGRTIPEPATFRDDYATRTERTPRSQRRIRRRPGKASTWRADAAGRAGRRRPARNGDGRSRQVTITRDGKEVKLTGDALAAWKYQPGTPCRTTSPASSRSTTTWAGSSTT
ncbi:MAG: sulfatase-like hydrolase/transferase [Vicinamibacteria bacterium]